jgi:Flp pilus assembly pilin Flp
MKDPWKKLFSSLLNFLKGEGSNSSSGTIRWTAMVRKLRNQNAQNLIEYAIIVALISAAVAALSTYVFRSVQATQKMITEDAEN